MHKKYCKPRESPTPLALVVRSSLNMDSGGSYVDTGLEESRKAKASRNCKRAARRKQKRKELRMLLTSANATEGPQISSTTIPVEMMKEIHEGLVDMSLDSNSVTKVD